MAPPTGTDWKVFLLKLSSRFARCKVLIVVVTPALYASIPCLTEIFVSRRGDGRRLNNNNPTPTLNLNHIPPHRPR